MATYKEPSPADHCYAKLIEMFGDTMDMELICEVGNSSKWDCKWTILGTGKRNYRFSITISSLPVC